MKDFIKWLGVNEKVAKAVVWICIVMIMLILTNSMLDSIGFPHYQITYENLKHIDGNKAIRICSSFIVCILNFYCIVLLVFRVREAKKMFKYVMLYTILNWIINVLFNYGILQVFIALFIIMFCYLYSGKNKKYILYGIASLIINTIIQAIVYWCKIELVDFSKINAVAKAILSIDYLIIMAIIIIVKEIYLKKRGEKTCGKDLDAGSGLANSKKKTNSQRKSLKK